MKHPLSLIESWIVPREFHLDETHFFYLFLNTLPCHQNSLCGNLFNANKTHMKLPLRLTLDSKSTLFEVINSFRLYDRVCIVSALKTVLVQDPLLDLNTNYDAIQQSGTVQVRRATCGTPIWQLPEIIYI